MEAAELVVATALVDKTAPDSNNSRTGWETDVLLRLMDAFVVVKHNDPAGYVEICKRALDRVQDLPEIAALVQLAIFRGERLLPVNPEREQSLVKMADELEHFISSLPKGTRKMRCMSLLKYHKGVFFNACGWFDLAAKMQSLSVEEARQLGDESGAAIALFCTVLYHLKDNLCNAYMAKATERFSTLERVFSQVEKATRGSALQVQWAEGNCPIHMIEACVWLDRIHSDWSCWVQTAIAASEKLGEAFKPATDLVRAADLAVRGSTEAKEALEAIANSNYYDNELRATALLILARRAMTAGEREAAVKFVSRMPEQGAQHVWAIGRRLVYP